MGTLELGIFSGMLSAADKAARPLGRRVRTPAFGARTGAVVDLGPGADTRITGLVGDITTIRAGSSRVPRGRFEPFVAGPRGADVDLGPDRDARAAVGALRQQRYS